MCVRVRLYRLEWPAKNNIISNLLSAAASYENESRVHSVITNAERSINLGNGFPLYIYCICIYKYVLFLFPF